MITVVTSIVVEPVWVVYGTTTSVCPSTMVVCAVAVSDVEDELSELTLLGVVVVVLVGVDTESPLLVDVRTLYRLVRAGNATVVVPVETRVSVRV